jgi:alkaline phosphatase D
MKKLLFIFATGFFFGLNAQTSISPLECISPFYHGVASGDPLHDRVILWTRVTPIDFSSSPTVSFKVALDPTFTTLVAQGNYTTNADQDFTVKVDVVGLEPNTFYYYEFEYEGSYSAVGRTKTLPLGDVDNIRLAVVSCANLEAGYFNVYQAINERNDVDAVLMLGDYIYEYETGGYSPNASVDRTWEPAEEIVDLSEYRLRYSTYHMDYALRNLHQNYPWICIWDDHETANDAFKDGAQNHSAGEGDWQLRKENGKQAFFEWLPIRPKVQGNTQIFRSFEFGNLADIIMLDTRLEGRDEQVALGSSLLNDTSRTILGQEQFVWLKDELSNSTQTWKVLGNQVMMGKISVLGSPLNTDGWDGYQIL